MAERLNVLVHGLEVGQAVIITCLDVVDRVGSWLSAEVADALISFEDDESSGVPVLGKSLLACAALPAWSLVLGAPAFFGGVLAAAWV